MWYFSFSDLLPSIWESLGPSMLLQMALFRSLPPHDLPAASQLTNLPRIPFPSWQHFWIVPKFWTMKLAEYFRYHLCHPSYFCRSGMGGLEGQFISWEAFIEYLLSATLPAAWKELHRILESETNSEPPWLLRFTPGLREGLRWDFRLKNFWVKVLNQEFLSWHSG